MSRFSNLNKQLGFLKALSFYSKLKRRTLSGLTISNLAKPFGMRNNPFDYATFEEVILNEGYDIPFSFTPNYIIDGGGNIGLTACFLASKYPSAMVVSVEPDTENYEVLKSNTTPYANIHAIKAGIWKSNAHLKISDATVGNNAFTVIESEVADEETIEAVSISYIMEQYKMPHIDILKLDIEGAEKEVFEENIEQWLPKTRVLIIELHDETKNGCSKSVFTAINKYDFSFSIKGENIIFTNKAFI